MASANKFNCMVGNLAIGLTVLGIGGGSGDAIKFYLSNTLPVATNTVKGTPAEITEQNGYSAPVTLSATGTNSSGTYTMTGTNGTVTASGGSVGPFEYVVMYDSTAAGTPLMLWWDYGSVLTLGSGDSFTVKWNNGASTGTVFTLA